MLLCHQNSRSVNVEQENLHIVLTCLIPYGFIMTSLKNKKEEALLGYKYQACNMAELTNS